jgi:hypothetical protein
MPNWTANELYVSFSSQEEKEQFKQIAQSQDQQFSFNGFIPMPEVLDGTLSPHIAPGDFINGVNKSKGTKFLTLIGIALSGDEWDAERAKSIIKNIEAFESTGYHNWHSWSCDNWGVKWDAGHSQLIEETDTTLSYNFDTAWDTPETFFRSLFAMYPHLEFRVVTFSMESDYYYEIVKVDGEYQAAHEYESFREAIEDGKLGGVSEWQDLFTDED